MSYSGVVVQLYCVVSLHCRWPSSTHNLQTWTGGVHQTWTWTLTMQIRDDQSSRLVTWDSLSDPAGATKEALLQSVRFGAMQYTTLSSCSHMLLFDPEWSCFKSKSSAETSSLQQREACRHGLQLVTGGPQQCGIIPVDAPENGQLCFCLGCVVLQVAAPFTTWAPFKEWLVFSGMTVVSELCYHGADWRTGIHFLHANKMHKQTTDVWGVGEHLGCLICDSSLLYRPK